MRSRSPLVLTARVVLWRGRHALAVLGVTALALSVARAAAPPPPPTSPVLVVRSEVAAGSTLGPGDVRVTHWPRSLVPEGALDDPADAVGRKVVVAAGRGVPVTATLLADGRFEAPVPPGAVVVPVRLADPAVTRVLRTGDRVDLVRGGQGGVEVLARGGVVLGVTGDDAGGSLLAGPAAPPLVLVAVPPAAGRVLAAADGDLGAVLVE